MTSRTPRNESSDVEDLGADIPTPKLESSLSCRKQGWLPFPPGKKNGSSSFRGSSDPSIAFLDNLKADEKSSSIATPLDISHSTLSFVPAPKLYKIKVEKLFYNLPPPNRSTLTKLKQFCARISPYPPKKDNKDLDDDDVYGKGRQYILRNINFEAKPGELLGIAGPSGSGKSTILECLAGRLTPSSPLGSILVNNQVMKTSTFRRISGYVMQDDALFPHLTVFETLLFSARLRLPSTTTMTEKCLRVQGLLIELGLQHAADTRIGNEMVRGVSGGERRRVSIGVDMIHDPAVLLLDEPTSGLDSAAAFNVVAMLRAMAVSRKRTVILSIHQPSLKILELIQSVLLVAGGMVVHHGSLNLLGARLATAGHEVTAETNLMEYAIDAVNSWETEEFMGTDGALGKRGKKLTMDQMLALSSDLGTCEDSNVVDSEKGDGHKDGGNGPAAEKFQLGGQGDDKSDRLSYPNSFLRETAILIERFFMNICRTKELFVARSIQAICAGTILGTVFLKMHNDRTGVQNRMGFFVFTVSFLLQSTTEALPIFLSERQVLQRETSRGAYRTASYVLSNALVFLPFFLFIAILYGAPSYWLTGLVSNPFNFLFYCLILWLSLVLANTFVALFSAIVPNYITGQAVFGALMGAFFLFSGYIINRQSIPKYWIWVHYISLFKYPYQALLLNEFLPNKDRCYDYGSSTVPAEAGVCLLTGSQALNNIGVQGRNKWMDVAIMVAFIFFYHLNTYAAVRWRLNRRSR